MSKISYDCLFKLLLIGSSSVGKTCLLIKYVEDAFTNTFISTIGIDFKIKTIELNGKRIKLQIWDTAGQERFRTITVSYYRGAMGILLVYDITNRKSFEDISDWMKAIKGNATDSAVVMVVGSKCDMEEKRAVKTEEGEEVAKSRNALFIETSAKTGHNVEEAFKRLSLEILEKYPSASAPARKNQIVSPDNPSTGRTSQCC